MGKWEDGFTHSEEISRLSYDYWEPVRFDIYPEIFKDPFEVKRCRKSLPDSILGPIPEA